MHQIWPIGTEIGSGQTKKQTDGWMDGWKQRLCQNYIPVILSGDKKIKLQQNLRLTIDLIYYCFILYFQSFCDFI